MKALEGRVHTSKKENDRFTTVLFVCHLVEGVHFAGDRGVSLGGKGASAKKTATWHNLVSKEALYKEINHVFHFHSKLRLRTERGKRLHGQTDTWTKKRG